MNNTIGIYYELPDGRIVYTFGWTGADAHVLYSFERGKGMKADQATWDTWKPRPDLQDWPNSKDPALPYVFDLYWDIKRVSDLKRAIEGSRDSQDILEKVKELNLQHLLRE